MDNTKVLYFKKNVQNHKKYYIVNPVKHKSKLNVLTFST